MAWSDSVLSDGTIPNGRHCGSTILFAKNGVTTVRQWEVVETTEKRALTEDCAIGASGIVPKDASGVTGKDSTVQTSYWAHVDGRTYTINVLTGTRTEVSGARKDDSGQWFVTETKHTFFATGLTGTGAASWGTTELDADGNTITLSNDGNPRVVSKEKSSAFVFNMSGDALFTTVETTVTEIRYINTQANASAIVSDNTAASTYAAVDHAGVISKRCWVPYGTEKFASSRFVSNKEGWTVTVTAKAHSFRGTNWSASITT